MIAGDLSGGPVAVMNLPRLNAYLIQFAKAVHDHFVDNTALPNPDPTLAVFAADIAAFEEAETEAAGKSKGAAANRNAKKRKVKKDLVRLRNYVQNRADEQACYADAVAVIESGFFRARKSPKRFKPELDARNTGISGDVALDAKALARTATYFWEYSQDQLTWTTAPETMQASTVITGLKAAQVYFFRFRALTRMERRDYSQVVKLVVQ